jgi:hypothetical protein
MNVASKQIKQVRKAEQDVIKIEMDLMWHERALRHKGFTNYSGLMTRDEQADAKERRKNLRAFIVENRKSFRKNAK